MSGTAAGDDADLALERSIRSHQDPGISAGRADEVRVGQRDPFDHLVYKVFWVVDDFLHGFLRRRYGSTGLASGRLLRGIFLLKRSWSKTMTAMRMTPWAMEYS